MAPRPASLDALAMPAPTFDTLRLRIESNPDCTPPATPLRKARSPARSSWARSPDEWWAGLSTPRPRRADHQRPGHRQPTPGPGGTIVHSDRRVQFGSWAFIQRARTSGLLSSMGSIGDSVDNATTESCHKRQRRHSTLGDSTRGSPEPPPAPERFGCLGGRRTGLDSRGGAAGADSVRLVDRPRLPGHLDRQAGRPRRDHESSQRGLTPVSHGLPSPLEAMKSFSTAGAMRVSQRSVSSGLRIRSRLRAGTMFWKTRPMPMP